MSPSKSITLAATNAVKLLKANGSLVGLSVGVSEYSLASGFSDLKVCANDAERVRNALSDVPQLGADKSRTRLLNAKTSEKPTKNTIIGQLRSMAEIATAEDRLLYLHSGHGTRINNELYLVPSDAYAYDDPDALIALSKVKEILSKSEARQKFIILDACYSGPNTKEFKSVPVEVSNTFVKKYVAETVGVALLSSSADDQMSTTQSPDSTVSLFTYYLLQALQGDPGALDANKHLTLFSLHSFLSARVDRQARSYQFRQRPHLDTSTNGDFFFGDFGASPVELQGLRLDQHPIGSLLFFDSERIQVKAILTKMRSSARFTEDQLQYAANKALPEHIRADFGRKAASLASALAFSLSEVIVEDARIYFPDGDLTVSYEANGKNAGKLQYEASFSGSWLERPDRMSKALAAFEMYPTEMTFKINGALNLDRMRSGLPAGGWTITSNLNDELEATRMGYTLQASKTELRFSGFSPKELFGDDADLNKASLVSGVLGLLGK
jgi:hypothetical protein